MVGFKQEADPLAQAIKHIDGWLYQVSTRKHPMFDRAELYNILLDLRNLVSSLDTVSALEARILHHTDLSQTIDPSLFSDDMVSLEDLPETEERIL